MAGMDNGFDKFAVPPVHVDFETATSHEPLHAAVFPGTGQGGQQVDEPVVALHQHFSDTCRTAEVAIYLERWMGIEHIRIGATMLFDGTEDEEGVSRQRQLVLNQFVGMLAV